MDNTGQRPIHYAAANGNLEIMKYFVEKVDGIEKEPKTFLGFYPIHWSASYGGLESTKYLIAKINQTQPKNNYYGKTPLDFARENIRIEVVKFLECYYSGRVSKSQRIYLFGKKYLDSLKDLLLYFIGRQYCNGGNEIQITASFFGLIILINFIFH